MIRSLLRRALVAAALGLGVTAGLARAGEPPLAAAPLPQADGALATGAVVGDGQEGAPCAAKHRLVSCLRPRNLVHALHDHRPLGCYANFNDYSCSNLRSEVVWLFGGCRQFFGERCLKGPPPSPVPGFDARTLTYAPPGSVPPTIVQPPCSCR